MFDAFNRNKSTYIYLFLTNSLHSFQGTMAFSAGLSNSHKMITMRLKSSIMKLKVKETYYMDYKKFSSDLFRVEFALSLDYAYKD